MISKDSLVFDKISNREGTVLLVMGNGACVIETIDNERFTQKTNLLRKLDKLTNTTKKVKTAK